MKRVYIVVVNWNGFDDTIECLESLFRLDYQGFRVVVCDNGSCDDSLQRIVAWAQGRLSTPDAKAKSLSKHLTGPSVEKPLAYAVYNRQQAEQGGDLNHDPSLVLIRSDENLGFAGGNNLGMTYALKRGDLDYVWLLNNDTVVDQGALQALVMRMSEKKG